MMRAVAEVTRPYNLKTVVSLNSIMIDGTGMCGGCRTTVGDETKFVCVDGPEFDAHKVNFKELMQRQQMYSREERRAAWDHQCKLEAQVAVKKIKRRERMPEQEPKLRIQNFNEVAFGYTRENALREAARCLTCKKPPCVEGCPVAVQIPEFIGKMKEGDFMAAIHIIKRRTACPQSAAASVPRSRSVRASAYWARRGTRLRSAGSKGTRPTTSLPQAT